MSAIRRWHSRWMWRRLRRAMGKNAVAFRRCAVVMDRYAEARRQLCATQETDSE